MNFCATLSIQAGGADQNDSSDILETYTDSTSLSGWVGEAGMVESGRSCHFTSRHCIGLLSPVMLPQKTCDWVVYVSNVIGIGSITVTLGTTTKAIRPNQRPYLSAFCAFVCRRACVCVCTDYRCFDKVFMT